MLSSLNPEGPLLMYVPGESETVEMNSQYLEILQRHIYLYEDVQSAALLCVVYI